MTSTRRSFPRLEATNKVGVNVTHAMTKQAKQGDVDLAFIGDSITQGWEGRGKESGRSTMPTVRPINLGIGGDRTEHVIWRLTHGNLGKIQPKVAVLMIGTNNTGHFEQDPAQVAAGVEADSRDPRGTLPDTKVILHGIFPRGPNPLDPKRLNNIAINQIIRRYADGDRVHFMEIGDQFLEPDGSISEEIMPDLLHISGQGYQRWADALEPKLQELGL